MEGILKYIILVPVILFAMTIHEFAHGFVAYLLGDDTAKKMGRLTLNPISHIDILGFIALFIAHIGWAKPVPIDISKAKKVHPRLALLLIALAGPMANFISAYIFSKLIFIIHNLALPESVKVPLIYFCTFGVILNIGFGVFNLLPLPPLDGYRILEALLPENILRKLRKIEPYSFIILLLILFFPPTSKIIGNIVNYLSYLLLKTYLY